MFFNLIFAYYNLGKMRVGFFTFVTLNSHLKQRRKSIDEVELIFTGFSRLQNEGDELVFIGMS